MNLKCFYPLNHEGFAAIMNLRRPPVALRPACFNEPNMNPRARTNFFKIKNKLEINPKCDSIL